MATKKATKKAATKKSPAKKAASKKSPAKKSSAKKSPAKKSSAKKSPAKKSSAKKSTKKYSSGVGKQVNTEMHEMHEGKLKSGRSGKKVTNPKQAIAIALSEARNKGEKVPPNPNE
jgi:Family of unknown function (DUF6496)